MNVVILLRVMKDGEMATKKKETEEQKLTTIRQGANIPVNISGASTVERPQS